MSHAVVSLPVQIYMTRFPYPRWLDDRVFASLSVFIADLYVYGFTLVVVRFLRHTIQDKQSRIKEYLRMMGLSAWVYWLNLFINGFLTIALIALMTVVSFKVSTHLQPRGCSEGLARPA